MTAEVGVLNRLGVALAADSAVTLGPSAGKIYTSAEKLFQLSEVAPVGVMVYGSADFLEVPWETILKLYRRRLARNKFAKLKDYVEDFLSFLRKGQTLFPADRQELFVRTVASITFMFLIERLRDRLNLEMKKGVLAESDILSAFKDIIDNTARHVGSARAVSDAPKGLSTTLRSKYRNIINAEKERIFASFPINQALSRKLTSLAISSILHEGLFTFVDSGVVIAGFGEDEHFPGLFEIKVRAMVANHPLYFRNPEILVGGDSSAVIVPFAQKEMVATFMDGIDPGLHSMIEASTRSLFRGVTRAVLQEIKKHDPVYGEKLSQRLEKSLAPLMTKLLEEWEGRIEKEYSDPVMEIVASLPKDELAAIAESLVNITKFKRRVSRQQETVGGPIDVAVITKGDGFVWIRRKHYFEPGLNPRIMARYHRVEEL
jgi:hypothetical protein